MRGLLVLLVLVSGLGCSTVVTTHMPEGETLAQPDQQAPLDASTETIEVFASAPR